MMSTANLTDEQVEIPQGIDSLEDFRRWVRSDEFPETGRIDYINGLVEVDIAADNIFWHSCPKTEIGIVMGLRVKHLNLGHLCIDKTRIASPIAGLSSEPDIVLVSYEAVISGRVAMIQAKTEIEGSYVEIEGPPDLVVEVVSDGSVKKDRQRLFQRYHDAGIAEYWLVDARGDELAFEIFQQGEEGYEPAEVNADAGQWSVVLTAWFAFSRSRAPDGNWRYDLTFTPQSDENGTGDDV